MIISFIKRKTLHKISYFPVPYTHNKKKTNVALDLSSYATESDLKGMIG